MKKLKPTLLIGLLNISFFVNSDAMQNSGRKEKNIQANQYYLLYDCYQMNAKYRGKLEKITKDLNKASIRNSTLQRMINDMYKQQKSGKPPQKFDFLLIGPKLKLLECYGFNCNPLDDNSWFATGDYEFKLPYKISFQDQDDCATNNQYLKQLIQERKKIMRVADMAEHGDLNHK